MKKIILIGIAAIVALYSVASCEKFEQPNAPVDAETEIENPADGDFTVTFECILDNQEESGEGGTKTVFHENSIWWAENDIISFYQFATVNGTVKAKKQSLKARENDMASIGTLAVNYFNTPDGGTLAHYLSWCPDESFLGYYNATNGNLCVLKLPAEQKPTTSSFDRLADIVISEYYEAKSNETAIKLRYTHPNSFGKMKIINMPSDNAVKTVEFSAKKDGQAVLLAGARYYDFKTGCHSQESSPKDEEETSISLNYSETTLGKDPTAYFCCYPFELGAGDSFKVTVTTTAGEVFEKEITLLEETINKLPGKKFVFAQNKATKFTVDMSTATKTCEWLSLSPYSSGSYVPTINKTYAGLTGSNILSVKWCIAEMDAFREITDFENYIETNGSTPTSGNITSLNSGQTLLLPKEGTIDTEYAFIVKATNNSGQSVILTTTARTDWFKLAVVTRTSGGVQAQLSGVGISFGKKYQAVKTTDIVGSPEQFYDNTVKPDDLSNNIINAVNNNPGTAAAYAVTKDYKDLSLVSNVEYTVMIRVTNTRGETVFRTASANAK